jgi:hypothetical protein
MSNPIQLTAAAISLPGGFEFGEVVPAPSGTSSPPQVLGHSPRLSEIGVAAASTLFSGPTTLRHQRCCPFPSVTTSLN